MRIYLNNNESYEIENINETYNYDLQQYVLNFDIINSQSQTPAIVNSFTSLNALSNIYIKDENNRIIFTSDLYKVLLSVNKVFETDSTKYPNIKVSISNTYMPGVGQDPMSAGLTNINNTLKDLINVLKPIENDEV